MKLIITGALGHIGSYVFRYLLKKKFIKKIYLIDNLQSQRYCSLFNIPKNSKIKFINIDLSKQLIDFNSDILIHFAAKTDAAQSHVFEKEFIKNRKITANILKYCNKHKVKMIFASSTSVYGPQSDLVDENCHKNDLRPQSPYALTKLNEEKDIQQKSLNNFLILRLGTIYGFSEGIRFHTAVNKFCLQSSEGKPLTIWKTALHQKRPYLSLEDLSKAIVHILKNNLINNEIYNLVSGNFTVNKIVDIIKLKNKTTKIKFVDHKIMNQLSYKVDTKKFQQTKFKFNAKLVRNINDTLKKLSFF
jgi:UDP-glucose 4-epimerase